MRRRSFLTLAAGSTALGAVTRADLPKYRIVSRYKPSGSGGMPGRYPGNVVRIRSQQAIDTASEKINAPVIRDMISRGMSALTSAADPREGWRSFFEPADVVGIKVNCSGSPQVM